MQSTDATFRPVQFRSQPAPVLRVVGDQVTPVIDAELGSTNYEVFDVTGPEGSGPPPHSHPWDEGYFVLEGRLAVTDWSAGLEEPQEQTLEAGGSAFIPGGTTHSFQVRTDKCRFMIITTPGAHAFFADTEQTLHGDADDIETLVSVAKRNGLSSPLFP